MKTKPTFRNVCVAIVNTTVFNALEYFAQKVFEIVGLKTIITPHSMTNFAKKFTVILTFSS